MGEDITQRKKIIMDEISFLETLVEEMQEDIEEMKYTQGMEAASRTAMGRMRSWVGVVFSIVLLVRLYFASLSIWQHWSRRGEASAGEYDMGTVTTGASTKRDPVTTFLLWLLGNRMVTEKEYNNLSQFISLLLTAYLSLSQERYFLRTMAAMHRRIHHLFCGVTYNDSSSSSSPFLDETSSAQFQTRTGIYMHLLAALMGSYFMSCIVLTKMMLPWQYRAAFSGALGGFDAFIIQSDVVNAMFAFSAIVSASILAMLFGIQKQRALLHSTAWKEDYHRQHQSSRPMGTRTPDV
jgi:hypothetical protein